MMTILIKFYGKEKNTGNDFQKDFFTKTSLDRCFYSFNLIIQNY